jgi:hypothetical protein
MLTKAKDRSPVRIFRTATVREPLPRAFFRGLLVAFMLLAGAAFGQPGVPRFSRESLTERPDGRPLLLAPGMIVTIYGEDLGPEFQCPEPIPQNGPYPTETCGVRVLVDGRPVGLLFSGSKQINFKIPDDAPEDGSAPVQVCVHDSCSDRVMVRFSLHKAFLHLVGHAYVHMPVWMEADQPANSEISYPYTVFPLDFGGAKWEVLYKGEPLAPSRSSIGNGNSIAAPRDSPRGRLPLHLIYRFDEPGVYSVRFTASGDKHIQSDWTDILVEPYSAAQRAAWLASEAAKARTATAGELVGDILPSLLAWPDDGALSVLLTMVDNPDGLVREFARMSLSLFDEDVQRRVIPANRWHDLHSGVFSRLG